ncbi:hypothetical protein CRG98_020304 [Punica granatum]|uniref:Uncharacterized protein n=1 Tax=Punica granatum TaxID=22663 RepID=A0A2I0JSR8_PUNGR|nr:hypothetical protein CRG98_020304 [Punica granatum]
MARERERVDLGPLTLTDLSDDGARCLLEGLSLEFEIAILSYEADMSPSGGDAPWGVDLLSIDVAAAMKLLRRCFAPGAVVCLTRWEPTLLLVDCLLLLLAAGLTAEAIACWKCPGLATGTFAYEAVARCPAWGGCSFAGWAVKGCVRDAYSSVSGRRGDPWRVFALAMLMRSHFRRPQCEDSKAPVGHARAYRDIFDDALATQLIIRRVCRLRTLLVKISEGGCACDPCGDFFA